MGRLHGFDDPTQGTEFFKVKEILRIKRPEAFLLENVKNLKGHDGGNTFAVIIRALHKLGYWIADITDEGDDSIMLSSISVAIIDGLPAAWHFLVIAF